MSTESAHIALAALLKAHASIPVPAQPACPGKEQIGAYRADLITRFRHVWNNALILIGDQTCKVSRIYYTPQDWSQVTVAVWVIAITTETNEHGLGQTIHLPPILLDVTDERLRSGKWGVTKKFIKELLHDAVDKIGSEIEVDEVWRDCLVEIK